MVDVPPRVRPAPPHRGPAELAPVARSVRRFDVWEAVFHEWLARHCVPMTRVAVGVIFFWFGVLKFFPGLSVAEDLAGRTIATLTFGLVPPHVSVRVLAAWECAIGLGLLTRRCMRATLVLLALQLPGTFLPLVFFRTETWTHFPYAPTLEGQYILKNLVLVAAGLLLGGTMHGGRVITDPRAAREAEGRQAVYGRYRRRFRTEPAAGP